MAAMTDELLKRASERNSARRCAEEARVGAEKAEHRARVAEARYEEQRLHEEAEDLRKRLANVELRASRITADNPRGDTNGA